MSKNRNVIIDPTGAIICTVCGTQLKGKPHEVDILDQLIYGPQEDRDTLLTCPKCAGKESDE